MFPMQGNQPDDKLYVDDVFSAYTYTGNGSTQTITNGIDLAGKGGMVWIKSRTSGTSPNILCDSGVGLPYALQSQSNNAKIDLSPKGVTSFNSNGFGVSDNASEYYYVNTSSQNYASWTFRKAPKFFDVVTWTGNGDTGRQIAHSLGIVPGMIICKCTSTTSNWKVGVAGKNLALNTTEAHQVGGTVSGGYMHTGNASATQFYLNPWGGSVSEINASGQTYVAYLFAHDTSADGIIQCGSFTTNGSGNATVNLGWEPQYLLQKSSSAAGNWIIQDSMRGLTVGTSDAFLYPNLSSAEGTNNYITPTATGFTVANMGASETSIYLAIRRPNKPPTVGTQVYNAIARTGTGAAATVTGVGFAPDLMWTSNRSTFDPGRFSLDRLRGGLPFLRLHNVSEEVSLDNATVYGMDGVTFGADTSGYINYSAQNYINHFFKRAPGVFDVVCYTGDGSAGRAVSHNLAAVPELMIVKDRSSANEWAVYSSAIGNANALYLQSTSASFSATTFWNSTTPTASVFTLGAASKVNSSLPDTYVAYLFATKPGISKCGNYTGNGTSQTINCGFTTGARFILIKRTDATGDWYVWDTVRGIIAGNDPHLSLNTTVAEVTSDDSIDPASSGFIVNQLAATNINVTSASYVFLAIA